MTTVSVELSLGSYPSLQIPFILYSYREASRYLCHLQNQQGKSASQNDKKYLAKEKVIVLANVRYNIVGSGCNTLACKNLIPRTGSTMGSVILGLKKSAWGTRLGPDLLFVYETCG